MPQPLSEDRPQSAVFSSIVGDLASAGITFRFQATGQSMFPTIRNGEVVHVEPLGESKLRRGDVLLFCNRGEFKAHRIVRIGRDTFITRGDTSLQADAEVTRQQIIGRIVVKECGKTGRVVRISGIGARLKFRLRRLRAFLGRLSRASLGLLRPVVSS